VIPVSFDQKNMALLVISLPLSDTTFFGGCQPDKGQWHQEQHGRQGA
jgi:hypothetical protein